ncbi:unknown [Haloarcula marismortui ATCC 43049]|jgi:rRNA maturation endonuclease Nob1|uniref:Uncharacterized protein n=1 Tax=Haloarcula marismortui (strain ATCC 43049 / DSM 3752 / JCM 8966 / VKM B-1809) TaxID=272569 RepID=Q5V5K7_HALMA|nr:hypothetical protein [Haloarcula marismortui]AAV45195.1 unknown [Haloarcula marismortui ATCC 43049]QCP92977.1 hypothetical protein E6P14_19710 [Haloarcula marismortui ATCC 43049]
MEQPQTYRCDGCGSEYRVLGEPQPKVVCRDCDREATLSGTAAAQRAYRLGYTRYREARRQLSDALATVEDGELALARGGFDSAASDFEDSVEEFTTAVREANDDVLTEWSERARKKATCLWQAAEWLSGMTYASEQGESTQASQYRHDAENRLQAATEYGTVSSPKELLQAAATEVQSDT